jgi:hypothetical protein
MKRNPKWIDEIAAGLHGYTGLERSPRTNYHGVAAENFLNRTRAANNPPSTIVVDNTPFDPRYMDLTSSELSDAKKFGYEIEEPKKVGFIGEYDVRPAYLGNPDTWTKFQFQGFEPKSRVNNTIASWNKIANRQINRAAIQLTGVAQKYKLFHPSTIKEMRRQIRNTAREDFQDLSRASGLQGKSYRYSTSPYLDAKETAQQARGAANMFPENKEATDAAKEEFIYQTKLANYYNPNNKYKNYRSAFKGALVAAPIINSMVDKRLGSQKTNVKKRKNNLQKSLNYNHKYQTNGVKNVSKKYC